jgi:Flp pilus assembly protein TadB
VALNPHSEKPDLTLPEDYKHDHPDEHPADWGWHGEWGRASRIAGWVVVVILLLFMTATHYNLEGALALGVIAALLVVVLLWDRQRRKNSWRQ